MTLFFNPISFYNNSAGIPLEGAKLTFFEAGTTTLKDVFSDEALKIPHTNPVIANANGQFPPIYLKSSKYKIQLRDSKDVVVYTIDNYEANPISGGNASVPTQFGAAGDGIADDITAINEMLDSNKVVSFEPNASYFVSEMPNFNDHVVYGNGATILVGDTKSELNDPLLFKHVDNLTIAGKNTFDTTISSINSVTGSVGDYSVTATLADGSNVSVGDAVLIKDVVPGTPGVPGSLRGRPPAGQIDIAFFKVGLLSTSGVDVTVESSRQGLDEIIESGDIVLIQGEVRQINGTPTATTMTLDKPLVGDSNLLQYWYHTQPLTGTISTNGTSVTGVGTSFTTQLNVGDVILINDGGASCITSIESDTLLTVEDDLITVSDRVFGSVVTSETHEGVWIVTDVNGNNVTWKNTAQIEGSKPAKNLINGGSVKVIKAVPRFVSATDGINIGTGNIKLNDIVIRGDDVTTTTTGLNTSLYKIAANFSCSDSVGVTGFGIGASSIYNSYLHVEGAYFSGNTSRGLNATEGGQALAQEARVTGNKNLGVLIGTNGYVRGAAIRVHGNSSHGARLEVGAAIWFDFAFVTRNGGNGILGVGGNDVHAVGSRLIRNVTDGIDGQNGIYGRASGALVLCNRAVGIGITQGSLEANRASIVGNGNRGAFIARGRLSLERTGICHNRSTTGVEVSEDGIASSELCHITGNGSQGALARQLGSFSATNATITGNTGNDLDVREYGRIALFNSTFSTSNQALGLQSANGLITDGTETNFVSFLRREQARFNAGVIPANSTVTRQVEIEGATDLNMVAGINCNAPVVGLIYTATIDPNGVVNIQISNPTNNDINSRNRTYTIIVIGV